jgi:carbamoylphosphate synthase small subunit
MGLAAGMKTIKLKYGNEVIIKYVFNNNCGMCNNNY